MKKKKIEKTLFDRSFAGQQVRGGSIKPHPTAEENEKFLNEVALGLCELSDEVEELRRKTDSRHTFIQFCQLCKDIIKKFDDNPLTFVTLIAVLAHTAINISILKRFAAD